MVDCSFVVLGGGVLGTPKGGRHSRVATIGVPSKAKEKTAEVAQLIEHQPSKLRVASLSLVFRSKEKQNINTNTYLITTTKLWQKKNLTGQSLT